MRYVDRNFVLKLVVRNNAYYLYCLCHTYGVERLVIYDVFFGGLCCMNERVIHTMRPMYYNIRIFLYPYVTHTRCYNTYPPICIYSARC